MGSKKPTSPEQTILLLDRIIMTLGSAGAARVGLDADMLIDAATLTTEIRNALAQGMATGRDIEPEAIQKKMVLESELRSIAESKAQALHEALQQIIINARELRSEQQRTLSALPGVETTNHREGTQRAFTPTGDSRQDELVRSAIREERKTYVLLRQLEAVVEGGYYGETSGMHVVAEGTIDLLASVQNAAKKCLGRNCP